MKWKRHRRQEVEFAIPRILRWVLCCLTPCMLFSLVISAGCSVGHGDRSRRLGREIIQQPTDWYCSTNDRIAVFAQDSERLGEAFDKVNYSVDKAGQLILGDAMPSLRPVQVYLVRDSNLWNKIAGHYAIHNNTRSIAVDDEIACRISDHEDLMGDAIPHEMIHVMIRHAGLNVPLALEEGVALHFGWEINLDYHLSQGTIVKKPRKDTPVAAAIPIDELLTINEYPAEPAELERFYRESERLVQALLPSIGMSAIPDFLRKMDGRSADWRQILVSDYQCSTDRIAGIERVVAGISEKTEAHNDKK